MTAPGTPLAGVLLDAYNYFVNSVFPTPPSGPPDPAIDCRNYIIVYVTDGHDECSSDPVRRRPDRQGSGRRPRRRAAAGELRREPHDRQRGSTRASAIKGIPVYVVGLNSDPSFFPALNCIATNSGGKLFAATDRASLQGALEIDPRLQDAARTSSRRPRSRPSPAASATPPDRRGHPEPPQSQRRPLELVGLERRAEELPARRQRLPPGRHGRPPTTPATDGDARWRTPTPTPVGSGHVHRRERSRQRGSGAAQARVERRAACSVTPIRLPTWLRARPRSRPHRPAAPRRSRSGRAARWSSRAAPGADGVPLARADFLPNTGTCAGGGTPGQCFDDLMIDMGMTPTSSAADAGARGARRPVPARRREPVRQPRRDPERPVHQAADDHAGDRSERGRGSRSTRTSTRTIRPSPAIRPTRGPTTTGRRRRATPHKLGDIFHSEPLSLEPPQYFRTWRPT